jgi:hypothetical protein
MRCLACSLVTPAGGTHLGSREAVGVCSHCGAGLCQKHAQRTMDALLVCPMCSKRERPAEDAPDRGAATVA